MSTRAWLALAVSLAAFPARGVELAGPDQLGDPGRWVPIEGSPPAAAVSVDGKTVLKLPCPFSTHEGWRVGWDLPVDADLGGAKWIKLRMRADDPDAVGAVVVYFQTGEGWYRAGLGGLTKEFSVLVGARGGFESEGSPGSWSGIRNLRLAVTPAAKRDTAVYLAGIEGTSAVSLEDAQRVGSYRSLEALRSAVGGEPAAMARIQKAVALLDRARARGRLESEETQALVRRAHDALADAYLLGQTPRAGEFRGAWCHSGTGPRMGWTKAIDLLADNGLNALFPNLLWSGVAYYPSDVVPVAPEVAEKGDQLAEILAAAKRRGVEVHVWKVCWQFGWAADPKVARGFRFADRMQVDRDGRRGEWLCPSRRDNRAYELDAIKEVVRGYDIDGFHLDYIRFKGDEWCYCSSCRRAFQKRVKRKFKDWPEPVVGEGPYAGAYADFRRALITSFVKETREAIRKIKPEVKLSAAVFPNPGSAPDNVLQDWPRWTREGLLDFVCPMNYTESLAEMRSRARAQLGAVEGRIPVYQGLYATFGPASNQAPDALAAQIVEARELGAGGFVLFELQDHVLMDTLPRLRLGVTAPE